MGLWERLGNVLKSYINDGTERVFGEERSGRRHGDNDYDAAYEELDQFLKGEKAEGNARTRESETTQSRREPFNASRPIPPELRQDFAVLGLSPGASEEECKEAYKKLLKIHHPDRHGKDPEAMKKATEKTSRINAAYDRLEKWFRTQHL
jgi:DnaJ-domain-containing protein 1